MRVVRLNSLDLDSLEVSGLAPRPVRGRGARQKSTIKDDPDRDVDAAAERSAEPVRLLYYETVDTGECQINLFPPRLEMREHEWP